MNSIDPSGTAARAPTLQKPLPLRASDLAGIAMLARDGVIKVADLAEDLHRRILGPLAGKTAPANASPHAPSRTAGITGFVYRSVRGVAALAGGATAELLKNIPGQRRGANRSSKARDQWLAIVNGVMGDHLAATNNPLAQPTQLCGQTQGGSPKLAIFVHGLCLNEHTWGAMHIAAAVAAGYQPLFVRYSSGLHIAQNGAQLANLLHAQLPAADCQGKTRFPHIVLIAHSMGGLVTRSAMAQGKVLGQPWSQHVEKLIFLGTPHLGAPLERAGAWVQKIWQTVPFAGALAPLASLRGAGITDLRFGQVLGRDPNAVIAPPLPRSVRCFAAAAALTETPNSLTDQTLGDGLVGIDSALGRSDAAGALKFPLKRCAIFRGHGHMQLLHAPAVAAQLGRWLSER